jgi:hypothetical protein
MGKKLQKSFKVLKILLETSLEGKKKKKKKKKKKIKKK